MVRFVKTTIGMIEQVGFTPHEKQCHEWFSAPLETPCYAVYADECLIAIGGDIEQWAGRHALWFVAGEEIEKSDWLPMLRLFSSIVANRPEIRRLEISVAVNYIEAIRMAHLIGFKYEGKMLSYMPDGGDAYLYAWVRK